MKKFLRFGVTVLLLAALGASIYVLLDKQFASEKKTVLFVPKVNVNQMEFWQVMNQGVLAAAQEYNARVEVAGTDTEADINGQIRILEEAIPKKPAAIVLAATDYTRLVPVAQKITDAGITLITVDSGLDGGHSASFIATDNVAAGKKAADMMKSLLKPGDPVAVINFVKGSATAMERESGVKQGLTEVAGLRIVDTLYCDGSPEVAYDLTKKLLQSNPDITGVIGLNEPSTVGAAKAVKELKAQKEIRMVGFDSSMEEVAYLEDGTLQAIVVQKPFNMGYLAIKTALEAIRGKEVGSRMDTGSEIVTKANMYTSENQKLLFPFAEK